MKMINYSQDVDALLIEASDESFAYAEENGQVVLHFSASNKLVLIEVLNVKEFSRGSDHGVDFNNLTLEPAKSLCQPLSGN